MKKVEILNLQLNHISIDDAIEEVVVLAKNKEPSYICFTNAHMTVEANKNEYIQKVVNSSNFAFADGAPVAKTFELIHGLRQERIAGMDFFPIMLEQSEKNSLSIGLLGSTDEVLSKIGQKIKLEYPNLKITHKISPPFGEKWNNEEYINLFNKADTNVVFVALGCPVQEKWMYENYKKINSVLLGVGGAFPVYADIVKRCPKWMQKNGLEWLYRLIKEPKRMWKRYLYTNTVFLKLFFKQLIRK